ncbi:putative NAD(P)H quinone oxidoreductase, PIG3 family [Beggiatoa alba B18LD]|uniref:Putative NAD(P)H quinone oxidoreductase, PIG3 family n=1 Tax=Beggiatoa alba B18LD TaxID=395493 RepID=I3CKP3_9GAMM|nr:NAD(P)H-quinone oxidoreductase [Beggiatoa alba]EIJ44186.1 putative NAD(P)H quinone oxidoreductase, PIG3 family [Beggiatoa alba B18LD]
MAASLTHLMNYIKVKSAGSADELILARDAIPQPKTGEVLIKVVAAGVNRPDVLQRQGLYPPPAGASSVLGLEVSGIIVAVGETVSPQWLNKPVCALLNGGGYAEYCTAAVELCLPIPDGMDFISAAALPETFFTVWTNVFERAKLQSGETFLVHGGSSGIGTTAIQLAKSFGATVIATAGNEGKCQVCRELGAHHAINYRTTDFVDVVKRVTHGQGVNVILDMVGGDYITRNLKALALEGRLVQIAFLTGSQLNLDLMPIMMKRLTLTGSTLRARSVTQKAQIAQALLQNVWALLVKGQVKPIIYKTFLLAQAAEAHRLMESNEHIGKIVLQME